MSFIESRLLTRVAYGFTPTPTWNTTAVPLYSGFVSRNAERSLPLYLFTAPYINIQPEHRVLVINAFHAAMGRLHGFRFKDHTDFEGTTEVLGTAVGGADETMQLIKTYTFGSESVARTIKKPVTGTVSLFEDGSPLASSVDTTTGIVTFTSTVGKVITATYEFDVPVMFMDDDLQISFVEKNAHSAEVNLKEDLSA